MTPLILLLLLPLLKLKGLVVPEHRERVTCSHMLPKLHQLLKHDPACREGNPPSLPGTRATVLDLAALVCHGDPSMVPLLQVCVVAFAYV